MIGRRGLLAGLGTLLAAPAIIRTPGLIMPVRPHFVLWGDGLHDDSDALEASLNGRDVTIMNNCIALWRGPDRLLFNGGGATFKVSHPLVVQTGGRLTEMRNAHIDADGLKL